MNKRVSLIEKFAAQNGMELSYRKAYIHDSGIRGFTSGIATMCEYELKPKGIILHVAYTGKPRYFTGNYEIFAINQKQTIEELKKYLKIQE